LIRYDYKCTNCGYEIEYTQSIKDKAFTRCESCTNDTLERVITLGPAFVSHEVKTIGQLADRNTKSMGTYEKQAKRKSHEDCKNTARRKIMEEKGLDYIAPEGNRPTPIYGEVDHAKINAMTPAQKRKYILEGK